MIFEISTFKLAKISSKILDTKKNFFFVELCYYLPLIKTFFGVREVYWDRGNFDKCVIYDTQINDPAGKNFGVFSARYS